MKKLLTSLLAVFMVVSISGTSVFAETPSTNSGTGPSTNVTATIGAEADEQFIITVPATITLTGSRTGDNADEYTGGGSVTATGYWAANKKLNVGFAGTGSTIVDAQTITMKDGTGADATSLDADGVYYSSSLIQGVKEVAGDDSEQIVDAAAGSFDVELDVSSLGWAYSGTFTGTATFKASLVEVSIKTCTASRNGNLVATVTFEEGMTWREWATSSYNTIGASIVGNELDFGAGITLDSLLYSLDDVMIAAKDYDAVRSAA